MMRSPKLDASNDTTRPSFTAAVSRADEAARRMQQQTFLVGAITGAACVIFWVTLAWWLL